MKITDPNGRVDLSGRSPGMSGVAPRPRSSPERASGGSDRVHLSDLSALMAAARVDSPVHHAKLSSLTLAVSGGAYSVDAGLLSHSIIEASLR